VRSSTDVTTNCASNVALRSRRRSILVIGESTKSFFVKLNSGKWVLVLVVEAITDAVINPKIWSFELHCSIFGGILPAFTIHGRGW
jgi:hypothetical protein